MNVMSVMTVGVSLLDCVYQKTDQRCVTNQRCVPGKRKTVKADLTPASLGVQGSYTEAPLRGLLGKDHRSEEIIEAKKLLAQVVHPCRRPFNCMECNASVSEKVL